MLSQSLSHMLPPQPSRSTTDIIKRGQSGGMRWEEAASHSSTKFEKLRHRVVVFSSRSRWLRFVNDRQPSVSLKVSADVLQRARTVACCPEVCRCKRRHGGAEKKQRENWAQEERNKWKHRIKMTAAVHSKKFLGVLLWLQSRLLWLQCKSLYIERCGKWWLWSD